MATKAIRERFTTPDASTLRVTEQDDLLIIHGVRVLNEVSRNGGSYSRRARESAARLANRLPVAIEHTGDDGQRRYTERVGQLREGRLNADGMTEADLYVNRGHALARQIEIDAKHMPENINLSIEIPENGWVGEDNRWEGGEYTVDDITEMVDCCIVARGGTTSTLHESIKPKTVSDEDDMAETTAKITESQLHDAVQKSIKEAEERRKVQEQVDKLTRQVEDKDAVIAKLQEQVNAYESKEKQRERLTAIHAEAKELEAGEISESYAASLAKLEPEEVTTQLKERAELLKKAGGSQEPSETPSFHKPSVGADSQAKDDPFPWMANL